MLNQIVKFNVKPEYREEFKAALLENNKATRLESGNIEMRAYVDNNDANLFFTYGRWNDLSALDIHKKSPLEQQLITLTEQALVTPAEQLDLSETSPTPVALKEASFEDKKFNIFFIFKFNPAYRERLLAQFANHISHTRNEQGCLLFDLYTVNGADDTLVVYEHWRQESDVWDIHFNQPYAKITGTLMEQAVVGDMKQYMNFVTQIA